LESERRAARSAMAPSSTELRESDMSEPPHADRGDPPPAPPRAPDAGDCCESGCEPCIYDLYWDAVARYEAALEAWKQRQGAG